MVGEREVGTLVHPRVRWPDEARDFTPWLAEKENLKLLGDEVGLSLEWVATEKPVGRYFLDILAKVPGTDKLVAIENQLEWSDTHHLGQLLTYATGCDTKIAIWVATGFCHEHAQALHRLNGWTSGNVSFYGVLIETVHEAGGSEPEPRFRKVVGPDGWNKGITLPPGTPPGMEYEAFFRPLITEVERAGFVDQPPSKRWGHPSRYFPSRVNRGISYGVSFDGGQHAWVTLHIETGDKVRTKEIFDALDAEREQIEEAYDAGPGSEWYWNGKNRYGWCSVSIRKDRSIHDPPENLEATRKWMLEHLRKVQEVFDPRIGNLLEEPDPPNLDGQLTAHHRRP